MGSSNNYIIFSSVDWTTHWQLHHQLTTSLISSGKKVLFVENTGIRSVNVGDIGRIGERISNWKKSLHGFSSIDDGNLTIYSPILLPFPYSKISLFFNKRIFTLSISRWVSASNFSNPIVISFLPTPLIQNAIHNINAKLTVYYCANNMAESSLSASRVRPYEDHFFNTVDIVFTAAHVIQEYAQRFSNKVYYFPPGIDFDKFSFALKDDKDMPSDLKKIKGPIVGYIGALGKVLDQKLICELVDQCSNVSFVFIGPEYTSVDALKDKDNIVFLGSKPHDQLPYYIKGFNVGIVPYICNDFTEGVYPSKLNEYLAMGIPAVSTNLREVRESREMYGDAAIIADSAYEFINSVKSLIADKNNTKKVNKRIEVAKANSWESRFKGLSKIIGEESSPMGGRPIEANWKKKFNIYFKIQSKRRRLVLTIVVGLLIIFYSPLFWFMGEQLIVSDPPKKTDAIVVFSGDGEVSYQNLSYQNRALEAVEYYQKGYANKIFLSSGREQTIADVDMIRLYLVSKGVPKSSIYILVKYPDSTYKNVIMVKQGLDENSVSSILFVTSPYHSLRSMLTWRKNAPSIEITMPNTTNQLYKGVQWGIGLNKMKVIVYEYAAIAHNWITGRI